MTWLGFQRPISRGHGWYQFRRGGSTPTYGKLTDRAAAERLELLEWVIIVLIAISIVLPFATGH